MLRIDLFVYLFFLDLLGHTPSYARRLRKRRRFLDRKAVQTRSLRFRYDPSGVWSAYVAGAKYVFCRRGVDKALSLTGFQHEPLFLAQAFCLCRPPAHIIDDSMVSLDTHNCYYGGP